ncbi:hypothetical protein EW145_g4214 [Phellinidium pouzarii]|uniref:DUF431-domain-containing protein n=1 Tax=Phellinidium pouzarii TaxID=167371 RepID=A0A4S4L9F5_9AGAM|nr:hypothetical protein EW145_g4214 [Phellinidium pouzarii]
MAFAYVIEHMEEDEQAEKTLPEWVELEYLHMCTLAGPDALIHFTHLSSSSSNSLSTIFTRPDRPSLAQAQAHQTGVLELMHENGVPMSKVCLLDPKAEKELSPEDGEGAFDWFLFGGILGDDPPRDRTAELRKLGFPARHLGDVQMTTDTAVGVTKLVVHDKVKLQDIPYIDFPTITFNAKESVEMPFRYVAANGQPVLPLGMRELLHKDLDKGFEF